MYWFSGAAETKDHKLRARHLLVLEAEIKVGGAGSLGDREGASLQASLLASGLPLCACPCACLALCPHFSFS